MLDQLLSKEETESIQSLLFSAFIDSSSYEKQQQYRASFFSKYGMPLSDCLWNCLSKKPVVISQFKAIHSIHFARDYGQSLYVLIDNGGTSEGGSKKRKNLFPIFVVKMDSKTALFEYIANHDNSDVYVFDESFDWMVIFTHEETKPGRRYCLLV